MSLGSIDVPDDKTEITIAISRKQIRRDLAAVRCAPCKETPEMRRNATPKESVVYTKQPEDLRHLTVVTEKIAEPADTARLAKGGRASHAHLEIAYERFPADQKLVGKREPGADPETPLRNQSSEESLLFRANFQVVLHWDELPVHLVEGKAPRFQLLQNLIQDANKLGSEFLKG